MSADHSSGLLLGFQLGLSYTLVGKTSLDALPRADSLLLELSGEPQRVVSSGRAFLACEGPRHCLRIRPRHGFDTLQQCGESLQAEIGTLGEAAKSVEGRLLATGMHPWLEAQHAEGWAHQEGETDADQQLQSLFGFGRHGWANQNPMLLSLPFANERAFAEAFSALRFAMPLMPALAASSPFAEGKVGPAASCRLAAARDFVGDRFEVKGGASFVPPLCLLPADYEAQIASPQSSSIRSLGLSLQAHQVGPYALDAELGIERINLRMLDAQESLQASLAVCGFVAACVGWLVHETELLSPQARHWPSARLAEILENSLLEAERGVIRDRDYLEVFGFPERSARFAELLQFLLEEALAADPAVSRFATELKRIVGGGSLATRLQAALPEVWTREDLHRLYARVADCCERDEML